MTVRASCQFLAVAGLVLPLQAGSAFAGIDDAVGRWKHPENGSIIETTKCDSDLCVTLVKVADPSKKDEHNPDAALRSRPLEGVVMINHAKPDGENAWEGDLYNVQDGGTYSGSVKLVSPTELKMEGCRLVFCKSVIWTKEPSQ